jgi:phosphatidylethanolamine/phosphatidyl-N-methylethanolamine N-methyltransferase
VRAPLITASLIPSSQALANRMAQSVRVDDSPVVELGPGTGVFTRALIARGVPEKNLVLVEINPTFSRNLRKEFPQARVIHGAAEELSELGMAQPARFVVSGIPLMSTSNSKVRQILASVLDIMTDDGSLVQFTYAPRCPVNKELMQEFGLKSQLRGVVLSNFPPARVYHIRKR